jgi:hypothetical protein
MFFVGRAPKTTRRKFTRVLARLMFNANKSCAAVFSVGRAVRAASLRSPVSLAVQLTLMFCRLRYPPRFLYPVDRFQKNSELFWPVSGLG